MRYLTIEEVRDFAKTKHEGHFRRDGVTPYFDAHLEPVALHAMRLAQEARKPPGVVEKVGMVGFLHDGIEDGKFTKSDLMKFGVEADVIFSVHTLTKNKYDDYIDYIFDVYGDEYAVFVKIADILNNLSSDPGPKQIKKYLTALPILYGLSFDDIKYER